MPFAKLISTLSLAMLLTGSATIATAVDLGFGFAAGEEGDDRLRPALNVRATFKKYSLSSWWMSRRFGPVFERTLGLVGGRDFDPFSSKKLKFSVGAALLEEHSAIQYDRAEDQEFDKVESRYNFGGWAGIRWQLVSGRKLIMALNWDSLLFPAGVNGGILLSTGRKQFFTFEMGVPL